MPTWKWDAKQRGSMSKANHSPEVFLEINKCRQPQGVGLKMGPSSLNQPGKRSPQVNSERRIRARVLPPQAQKCRRTG